MITDKLLTNTNFIAILIKKIHTNLIIIIVFIIIIIIMILK